MNDLCQISNLQNDRPAIHLDPVSISDQVPALTVPPARWREARELAGLTIDEVSALSGIASDQIQALEAGRKLLIFESVLKLRRIYSLPLGYCLGLSDSRLPPSVEDEISEIAVPQVSAAVHQVLLQKLAMSEGELKGKIQHSKKVAQATLRVAAAMDSLLHRDPSLCENIQARALSDEIDVASEIAERSIREISRLELQIECLLEMDQHAI